MDLIILALAAGFILYKLFTTLGQRTGIQSDDIQDDERERNNIFDIASGDQKSQQNDDSNRQPKEDLKVENLDPHLRRSVQEVTRLDPNFSIEEFAEGASIAFEMILDAYAEGNIKSLKPLLSKDLLSAFKEAIEARAERGESFENTLVRIEKVEIEKIELEGSVARVRTEIISEQIPITRDKKGDIVEGNPEQIDQIFDYWTFERNLKSKDPNWLLVSTEM